MRVAQNDWDDRAGLRGYVQFNKYTHTHTHTHKQVSLIPPWEDQREWHRMTRMTGPECAVMCNLINTHTHTHIHTYYPPPPPPWEDQCGWHIIDRMTGSDCAVKCKHTYTHVTSIIDPPLGGSMRVAYNGWDDRAGLRGYVQFNKYTHTQEQ